MSGYAQTPADWAPHNDEIHSLYVDQDWTLEATQKHMEATHGFRAT